MRGRSNLRLYELCVFASHGYVLNASSADEWIQGAALTKNCCRGRGNGFGARKFKAFLRTWVLEHAPSRTRGETGFSAGNFQIFPAEHEFQRSFSGQPSKLVGEANSRSRDSLIFLSEGSPRGLLSISPIDIQGQKKTKKKLGREYSCYSHCSSGVCIRVGGEADIYGCKHKSCGSSRRHPDRSWVIKHCQGSKSTRL